MLKFNDNDIEYIKNVFDFVNENNEDYINFNELKKGIITLGGELSEKEEENLKFNKNKYNFEDFINICQVKQLNVNELSNKLLSAFKLLETNKLGYINKNKIENLLNNDINEREMNLLIKELNPDENGNINYEEFTKEMIKNYNLI
jgi:Ca2+-binding EF-hand superfamily protein